MKRMAVIFFFAFVLNFVWENLHSLLYENYMGRPITEFILLRATLADAVMIAAVAFPFLYFSGLRAHRWIAILLWIILAVVIELFALSTGRWAYNEYMPLVPFLGVGLTPTIQLALLGYLSLRLTERPTSQVPSEPPEHP